MTRRKALQIVAPIKTIEQPDNSKAVRFTATAFTLQ